MAIAGGSELRGGSQATDRVISQCRPLRETLYSLVAMAKSYHVTTFGCQMNEHDSERMKGMLESLGYSEAQERSSADLILFNTC